MGDSTEVLTTDPLAAPASLDWFPTTAAVPAQTPAVGLAEVLAGVLAEVMHVEHVPVDGHFFDDLGADSMVLAQFCARVRRRGDLPTVSIKDVYQHPTAADLATTLADAPLTPVQRALAGVLAEVLQVEHVPVDGHFFDDLGADSMVMAQFCARLRKQPDLPSVSMKDVYQHPTISSLATALTDSTPGPVESVTPPVQVAPPATTAQYVLCGALQLLTFLAYTYLVAVVTLRGFIWISKGSNAFDDYTRAVVFGGGMLLGTAVFPILAKWVLVGRWKPQEIQVWSLAYYRFWLVKTLIRANPLVIFFVGSPIFVLYLRALGAKVGRNVVILAKTVPVCTDLFTVGDNAIIRKDVAITGYRAEAGVIRTGPVTLGKDVLLSEATVLDIDTSMGDAAQLGHRSALLAGQAVPAGERWHGSPARRTEIDFRTVGPARCGSRRRIAYSVVQVLHTLLVNMPMAIGALAVVLAAFPDVTAVFDPGTLALTTWSFYVNAAELSAVVFFGGVFVGLLFVMTVPRVLALFIRPEKVYPLYGFHFSVQRTITRTSNSKFFTGLFGDSSYIVPYLRWLGYDLGRVVQSGSNFGTGVKHESPYLTTIGSGTMVADGLTIINADFSNTSFRASQVSIGPRNFLGNGIAYPAQGKTGDNCLLATKVMVPIDGPVREGVGLLGSPAFEIPRSVDRDARFDHLKDDGGLQTRLAAKNRYNLRTMVLVLLVRWLNFFGITLIALIGGDLHQDLGALAVALSSVMIVVFTLAFGVLVERAVMRFRSLRPQFCSIYHPYFWWHERYWKLLMSPAIFNGTPFKGAMWRLLGVRIGRRVFDDGCDIPERTLVTVGDGATLNAGSWLQAHSQEDGAFKSDHITVGAGATIGVGAWTHYGVVVGEGAVLDTDSFLMKGEEVPPNAQWGGNPATEVRRDTAGPLDAETGHDHHATAVNGRGTGRHRAPRDLDVARLLPAALHASAAAPRHR